MKKKRAVVLGAGVSGLAAAYALKATHEVVILEKNTSSGGVMRAIEKEGFFFECGPRTFRARSCPKLLALAGALGLREEIIGSAESAKKRYILAGRRLQETPSSLLAFFTSPLCNGLRKDLLREWKKPCYEGEETIYEFAERRFGQVAADRFFDPISLGVFGSCAKRVSVSSALPKLKEWESLYGSVSAGLFRSIFRRRKNSKIVKSPLFSFRRGTPALVQALHKELEGVIHLEEEVLSLQKNEKLIVKTAREDYPADVVVSALPPAILGRLVHDLTPDAAVHLQAIPMSSLTVVHFGYRGSILPLRGFGYLVPTSEGEKVMGVVFDSEIFPEHNRGEQTRLTVMLQGSVEEAEACARDALERHLGLSRPPDAVHIEAQFLPVMEVGHNEKISAIQNELKRLLPQLHLVGNYLGNPSVESCIERALNAKL